VINWEVEKVQVMVIVLEYGCVLEQALEEVKLTLSKLVGI